MNRLSSGQFQEALIGGSGQSAHQYRRRNFFYASRNLNKTTILLYSINQVWPKRRIP